MKTGGNLKVVETPKAAAPASGAPGEVVARAGYSVEEWCFALGIGRTSFYAMGANIAPKRIKIGKRSIVIEPPGAWAARVAEHQAVEAA